MAMLGKRFQRTTSMSQIGPGSNLHTETVPAQAQAHGRQHQQEGHLAEQQPANQWGLLKQAEAMMMMMMGQSGAHSTDKSIEEGLERHNFVMAPSSAKNEQPQIGLYPCSHTLGSWSSPPEHLISSPSPHIVVTHNFLDVCFFCKRRLRPERDIFIYRGDAAFCTEECRHRHICDEVRLASASKKGGPAATETAVAA